MTLTRQAFLRGRFVGGDRQAPALAIDDGCLSLQGTICRVCEEACEGDAIRFRLLSRGRNAPSVDLERCTACGTCADICPVGAISIADAASFAEAKT